MSTWLQLLILTLATFRLVKLLIDDLVLEPLRERTVFKLDPRSKLREMLECAWCVGFWLAVIGVVLYAVYPDQTTWVALPFAVSAGVGLLAEHVD